MATTHPFLHELVVTFDLTNRLSSLDAEKDSRKKLTRLGRQENVSNLCQLTILSTVESCLRPKSVFSIVTQFIKEHNIFLYVVRERWKPLAEKLGLSKIEIHFLDEKVPNPSHFVFREVAKHRHLSVGEIYDTLVDCELPVVADLM